MIAGYFGCDYGYATNYPFWKSTKENGASDIDLDLCQLGMYDDDPKCRRNELCPLDKYGYDARCRGWYEEGRRKAEAGNGTLHISGK